MNHQNIKNKGILNKVNMGFTLVEMIVVLTIMAIMMGGAVWGVTGWIAHYEYESSEEKAKTIYMAAQSALSAAESRGTLVEYMKSFEGVADGIVKFATNPGDAGLDKETYGIPIDTDNEGNIHEYGYMVVKTGDYTAHPEKPLFKMLEAYVSDAEQLNASIVVEFDLTSNKVYSAFYSNWATSIQYSDSSECVERGDFFIKADNRKIEFRENYQVGYYSSDQVNVVKLDNLPQLKMVDCELHNEETLFLTVKSSSGIKEADTIFNISLLEDTDEKPVLCSFSISRNMLMSMYDNDDKNKPVLVKDVPVYDSEGKKINNFNFVVSLNECEKAEDGYYLSVVLDGLSTDQSMAFLDEVDPVTKRTGNAGYSITRLIGTEPMNILASVTVEPLDPTLYSSSRSLESNTENSLYVTKEETGEFAKYFDNDNAYLISRNRHLSNIRYVEDYNYDKDKEHQYVLTKDLDFDDAVIYDGVNKKVNADFSYYPLSKDDSGFVFPMITKLNEKSVFNGEGNQLVNFKLSNNSSVAYEHGEDGKVISANSEEFPVNKATTVGLFGVNKGMIKRLILSKAVAKIMSKEEYDKSDGATGNETTRKAIYSDSIQAAGVLCGRNEGDLREIYFDKDCKLEASVFANLNDIQEAKDNGIDTTDPEQINNLNQRFGSGIGMAAGTVALKKNASIDRIMTSGSVKGKISGKDTDYKEVPDVSDEDERKEIYNETPDTANGESVSNAQYYSYGVGGVFGYVYGKYDKDSTRFGIGVDKETVETNNTPSSTDDNHYIAMKKRSGKVTTEVLSADGGKKNVTSYNVSDTLLFAADETRSIINKADVTGDDVSFIGGIVGNLYIAGLADNKVTENDEDGYVKISDTAHPHMLNCCNYGDTKGNDFVGGVVGINGEGGYIKSCESYGCPSATKGVSAGIASENFGFMNDCLVDRAEAEEDHDNKPYVPQIKGNMLVAGAITSVNHENCIVSDCDCSIADVAGVDDKIIITGNDVDTLGYLVGRNDGVVDNGRSGKYLGYKSNKTKLIIGGAVGTNSKNAVVKNVEVTFNFVDEGQAECIGGVVGLNKGEVNNCKFGGSITKNKKSSARMTIGGIAGKNGDGTNSANIKGCYIIGGQFNVTGFCNFVETDTSEAKITKSSKVGGICGINYSSSKVEKCYITGLSQKSGNDGKAVKVNVDGVEVVNIIRQSIITVKDGMTGGVTAVNYGTIKDCGYTDKAFYEEDGDFVCSNDTVDNKKKSCEVSDNMTLFSQAEEKLKKVSDDDSSISNEAVIYLNQLLIDDNTGELTDAAKKTAGYLTYNKDKYQYALPKYEMTDTNDGKTWDAYSANNNQYIISMGYKKNDVDVKGKGCIGGIVGFNTEYGRVDSCATGRWLVENYMPLVTYDATGGVIGNNAADDKLVNNLINFAYVRLELPIIYKNSKSMNISKGTGNSSGPDNRFHYVGGVIGTQYNKTKTGWYVEKCINVGKIVNYYGHNTGGVLGQACGMGGNVQYCYNYGMTMTGYSTEINGSMSGTAGGIVSHYTNLEAGQVSQVLHCNNYGVISFPMQGLEYETSLVKDIRANMAANDVGGIVGEISAPLSTSLYTVNIKDCVNGRCSRIYSFSKCAGIVGQIGCLTKDNVNTKYAVNSLFVNIDTCRNYSSDFWTSYSQGRKEGTLFTMAGGGISAGRDKFDPDTNKDTWTGYTTIRNCFSVRMNGNYNYNNKDSNYSMSNYSDNYNIKMKNGMILFTKAYDPLSSDNSAHVFKYCGNNYYLDESSFQYTTNNGLILKSGYDRTATKTDAYVTNDLAKVNVNIATSEPADNSKKYATYNSNFKNARINKVDDLSVYIDDYNKSRIASERIVSASYFVGTEEKYVLFVEPKGVVTSSLNAENAWIDENEGEIKIRTKNGIIKTNILYNGLSEHTSSEPYNRTLIDHFYFDRIKKNASFRNQAADELGENLDNKVNSTRLPILDEYDIDYYELDNKFTTFINVYKAKGPDTVYDVNVKKSDNNEYYEATWKIKSNDDNSPSATEFDVKIQYIRLDSTEEFDPSKISDYLGDYHLVNDYAGYSDESDKVYGTKTVFKVPDKLMKDDGKYYAVVRVRDSRDEAGEYSRIENTPTIKSYVPLEPKMPTPEFEIVKYTVKNSSNAYESRWMLHLTNPEKFAAYASLPGFEIGAYQLNNDNTPNASKTVKLSKDKIVDAEGNVITSNLLNNAVDIEGKFTTNKADLKLYGYAKADGYLDADPYNFTVYIPSVIEPSIDYKLDPEPRNAETLNNVKGQPEYKGTLTYNSFNGSTKPPVDQVFRVELYGVKSVEENGVTKKWHETVAYRDYPLSVGESAEVDIGHFEVPKSVDLTAYESFDIDYWYASPGDGCKIYNYFEITDEWKTIAGADRTVRSSGYIKDLSTGTEKNYFHTTKLPDPKFMAICVGRKRSDSFAEKTGLNDYGQSPEWYIVLTNADDYPVGTQIVRYNENTVAIDMTKPASTGNKVIDSLFDYAAPVQTGWSDNDFWAKAEGSISSNKVKINPSKKTTVLFKENNLRNNLNINYDVDESTYKDEDGNVSDGCFVLDENNDLTFKGTVRYNSQGSGNDSDIPQYFRYEIFARDKITGQYVTLLLSEDIKMDGGSVSNLYKHEMPVGHTLTGVGEKYEDFHFAVWYSKSAINSIKSDADTYTYHYTEITETAAKSYAKALDCYDEEKDIINNARDIGILIDISKIDVEKGITEPTYYYVTALYDKTYGDATFTENYKKYVLYRESSNTISTIKKNDKGEDDFSITDGYVDWSMYNSHYSSDASDIECKLDVKVYQVPHGYTPSGADELLEITDTEVEGKKKVYEDTPIGTTHYRVKLPNSLSKQLDWDEYDYYAVIRVKDKDVLSEADSAYSSYYCFPMNKPLPTPEISVSLCGYSGDVVYLDNYADYAAYNSDRVKIYVEVEGKQKDADKPYVISVDPEQGGNLKNKNEQIKIPYLALMTKYYNANGSKLKLVAYAVETDEDGNEVDRSASLTTKVYIPQGGEPVVENTHLDMTGTEYTVIDKHTINFKTTLNYYIDGDNEAQRPSEAQGFAVALVGKPNNKIEDKYNNPVILAKTNADQYTYIEEGNTGEINVELTIPDDVDIDDYNFDGYGIFVWCVYGRENLVPYTRIDLTRELFEKYYNNQGVAIDYSNGKDKAGYCIERMLYDDGNKELPANYNSVKRGTVKLEFDPDE